LLLKVLKLLVIQLFASWAINLVDITRDTGLVDNLANSNLASLSLDCLFLQFLEVGSHVK